MKKDNNLIPSETNNKYPIQKHISIGFLVIILVLVQMFGGFMANSLAIISDSIYLCLQSIRFISSLIIMYLERQQTNSLKIIGYNKIKFYFKGINLSFTIIFSIIFIYKATIRIIQKQVIKEPIIMLLTSIFGLLINFIIFKTFGTDYKQQIIEYEQNSSSANITLNHDNSWRNINKQYQINQQAQNKNIQFMNTRSQNHSQQLQQSQNNNVHQTIAQNKILYNFSKRYLIPVNLIQSIFTIGASLLIYLYAFDNTQQKVWNYWHLCDPISTYISSILNYIFTITFFKEYINDCRMRSSNHSLTIRIG